MSEPVSGIPIRVLFGVLAFVAYGSISNAQASSRLDLAVTYTAERGNPVGTGGNFWLQGGSVDASITVWHGLSLAGNLTGTHSNDFGPARIPLGLIAYTGGPRYRFAPRRRMRVGDSSIFGQALFGGAHGFDSIFPNQSGQNSTANAFAAQIGGGLDIGLNSKFAVRPIEANWVRMQFPNSTTNVQNDLRLSAGIVFRIKHIR